MIIPEKIEVGFCKRTHKQNRYIDQDEFYEAPSYLLGFATFKDKGQLRKEKSWNDWRDKSIPSQTLNNIPREGFMFAEYDKRDSAYFGSGRTMWRISDPYGFDLEISSDNLMGILCNANIIEGQLIGEFIWAWEGKDLALISVNSDIYKEAVELTIKKNQATVTMKDVVPGNIIETPEGIKYIYHDTIYAVKRTERYRRGTSVSYTTGKYIALESLNESTSKKISLIFKSSIKIISIEPGNTNVLTGNELVNELNNLIQSELIVKKPYTSVMDHYLNINFNNSKVFDYFDYSSYIAFSKTKISIEDITKTYVDAEEFKNEFMFNTFYIIDNTNNVKVFKNNIAPVGKLSYHIANFYKNKTSLDFNEVYSYQYRINVMNVNDACLFNPFKYTINVDNKILTIK